MYDVNTASREPQACLKFKWVGWSAVAACALLLTGCESDDQSDDNGASDLLWHASEHRCERGAVTPVNAIG